MIYILFPSPPCCFGSLEHGKQPIIAAWPLPSGRTILNICILEKSNKYHLLNSGSSLNHSSGMFQNDKKDIQYFSVG